MIVASPSSFAKRTRATLCALAIVPAVLGAQRGLGAAPPRDPMQELLPLRPTRTLTFTTKVGNWMSTDVSSDGRTIAFDLLGDIYTMPIAGGKATALTRGMGFDGQPRFSPDGRKIVYVSDRTGGYNIWTISVDRKDTVQITTGNTTMYESPIWTPDGKYIIATRGTKLWLSPPLAERASSSFATRHPRAALVVPAAQPQTSRARRDRPSARIRATSTSPRVAVAGCTTRPSATTT